MQKMKNALLFAIAFLIIVGMNFLIYINIDKVIPEHKNELYTFPNTNKEESYDLIYEMYNQIREVVNYRQKITEEEIEYLKKNEIVYNIISKDIYDREITITEYKAIIRDFLNIGVLVNTIYGNINFVIDRGKYYIAYSEDFQKICYYKTKSDKSYENTVEKNEPSKEEIIRKVKKQFSETMVNIDFNPNIILYNYENYILRDNEKNITVYYDNKNDDIFGFYIGFDN